MKKLNPRNNKPCNFIPVAAGISIIRYPCFFFCSNLGTIDADSNTCGTGNTMNRKALITLFFCIFSSSLLAQDASQTNSNVITQQSVYRRLIAHNPEIQISRLSYQIAVAGRAASQNPLDPTIAISSSIESSSNSEPNVVPSPTGKTLGSSVGINQEIAWGTAFNVNFKLLKSLGHERQDQQNYKSSGQFKITQPLLKNRHQVQTLAEWYKADAKLRQSKEKLRQMIVDKRVEALNAFWDLYVAQNILTEKYQTLAYYGDLLAFRTLSFKAGRSTETDIWEVKAKIALENAAILLHENTILALQDDLTKLLAPTSQTTSRPWVAKPFDTIKEAALLPSEQIQNHQILAHPAVIQKQLDIEQMRLDQLKAANALLPQLNIYTDFNLNGYAANSTGALANIYQTKTWEIGLVFNFPLGNFAAQATHQKQLFRGQRLHIEKQKLLTEKTQSLHISIRNRDKFLKKLNFLTQRLQLFQQQILARTAFFEKGKISFLEISEEIKRVESEKTSRYQLEADWQKESIKIGALLGDYLPSEKELTSTPPY